MLEAVESGEGIDDRSEAQWWGSETEVAMAELFEGRNAPVICDLGTSVVI